jgi:hypothetical protein
VRIGIGYSTEERQRIIVVIVRCCIRNLSFSVNALAQSRPDQRGSGDFPKTAVKIAAHPPASRCLNAIMYFIMLEKGLLLETLQGFADPAYFYGSSVA